MFPYNIELPDRGPPVPAKNSIGEHRDNSPIGSSHMHLEPPRENMALDGDTEPQHGPVPNEGEIPQLP